MTAWQNVKVWEEEKSSRMRPPLPLPIWVCMVGIARGRSLVVNSSSEKSLWCCLALRVNKWLEKMIFKINSFMILTMFFL